MADQWSRRRGASSDAIQVIRPWFKITWSVAKSPRVAEQCELVHVRIYCLQLATGRTRHTRSRAGRLYREEASVNERRDEPERGEKEEGWAKNVVEKERRRGTMDCNIVSS
ncbi:hypothetical protein TNCV_4160321 [Trichonephila clavipes]|nr:hypothetical protein TNCV_4160321 [Trichonephila clavipes]